MKDVAQEAEVDKNVACDVMQWFREVCSTKFREDSSEATSPCMQGIY